MSPKKRSFHSIRDFLFVIFKYKTFIILFPLATVLVVAAVCFFTTPVYEASSKLLVNNPVSISRQNSGNVTQKLNKDESTIDTAVEILTGRYISEKVIGSVGLKTIFPHSDSKTLFGKLSGLQRTILQFRDALTVNRGNLIEVKFQHKDPAIAATVVNKLIEEFLDYYRAIQKQHQKYGFFKEQVSFMENKLAASQKELGLFRNTNNISSISKQKSLLLLQVSELEIENSKTLAEISEQEGLAESQKKTSSAIADTQKRLIALKSKTKKLGQLITRYKLELNRLDKTETRLRELERQVDLDEENYMLYAKKLEEARISNAMDEQKNINFSVIEPALPPITAIKPQKTRIITAAIVLGIISSILLAFVLEFFSHTIDNIQEMEATLGCSAAASFSELNKQEIGMMRQLKIPDKIMKECNRIKHHLSQAVGGKNKAILFSSSKEKEGTSTVLFSLAVSLASEGEKVLAVDTNLRNPAIHSMLNLDNSSGLSDIIADKTPLDNVIKETQIKNLFVLTSGTQHLNPLTLLQSEDFDSLMQKVKTKADWVLFDSPPTNTFNDSSIIASRTDSFIMVVKSGSTRWQAAKSALNQIMQWSTGKPGTVLNRKKMHIPDWLYKIL